MLAYITKTLRNLKAIGKYILAHKGTVTKTYVDGKLVKVERAPEPLRLEM